MGGAGLGRRDGQAPREPAEVVTGSGIADDVLSGAPTLPCFPHPGCVLHPGPPPRLHRPPHMQPFWIWVGVSLRGTPQSLCWAPSLMSDAQFPPSTVTGLPASHTKGGISFLPDSPCTLPGTGWTEGAGGLTRGPSSQAVSPRGPRLPCTCGGPVSPDLDPGFPGRLWDCLLAWHLQRAPLTAPRGVTRGPRPSPCALRCPS